MSFGRIPRSARRSGFPLQVLLLPAVVVRAFRFNPLRGAKDRRFRPVTGIPLKRSVFEFEALLCRERFTQFFNAPALIPRSVCNSNRTETNVLISRIFFICLYVLKSLLIWKIVF
ncbi:MAG: hypothetical protein LBH90_01160 [Tannerella sp.]|nr:hypothetical protein [Tannerella sp.]